MSFVPTIKSEPAQVDASMGGDAPLIEYRPRFVFWTSFLAQLPVQLFFTFWAGTFFGGMLQTFLAGMASASRHIAGTPFLVVGGLVFVGFPFVTLTLKAFNYTSTVYRLFPDRLAIDEGFLTQHRKEIALSGVREVNLRLGILQRMVGLGSVYVATQATGTGERWSGFSVMGGSSTFGSGAMLRDLEDAADAYARLTALRKASA